MGPPVRYPCASKHLHLYFHKIDSGLADLKQLRRRGQRFATESPGPLIVPTFRLDAPYCPAVNRVLKVTHTVELSSKVSSQRSLWHLFPLLVNKAELYALCAIGEV